MSTKVERAKVKRLLWRAGFGPRPGEVEKWAAAGHRALVERLLNPKGAQFDPITVTLDPVNVNGHDVLWWFDRAVRTRQPLAERMAFNWHDHLAVSNAAVGDTRSMLSYYSTLRGLSLGRFRVLMRAVTLEGAMQLFLDIAGSSKEAPNENFARELFELFTLGANNGYTEQDVREAARALTGFWWDYDKRVLGYDRSRHDYDWKTIFGRRGVFAWDDVIDLAVQHPAHAPYLCRKLWGYLSPRPCPKDLLRSMVRAYRSSGTEIRPVLRLALTHPAFYAGLDEPDQVKPPLVYLAGMLRATDQDVTTGLWLLGGYLFTMGQAPFYPPNVAGWPTDGEWLSTATIRTRYAVASYVASRTFVQPGKRARDDLREALDAVGRPWASTRTLAELDRLARTGLARGTSRPLTREERRRLITQALLGGPDAQVC